ncbi:ABC transporter permease [Conexibacter stalactiti]|uniref:ABC transporter permease n=1 Tax=Conexibacter stalactiti TaxID=1940611 RepID=A0ABU4HL14_9ACTN|nr:ABC transporter permease [Conexibacter stalactiti]MDW5593399.1 ABC transporter permease [Conexibacter stalactiti]MEC5034040.1 ABC transporter permease [Conexibacter stalactiti]
MSRAGSALLGTARFLARRLPGVVLTLLISTFVIYSALDLAPGSPLRALTGGRAVTPETAQALTEQYHLDDPFLVRYVDWLGGVVTGDFGSSYVAKGQPVGSLIVDRLPTTLWLLAFSALLIVVIGVGLGTFAALRGRRTQAAVAGVTAVGMGVPSFVAASVLISYFAVQLGWFPVFGPGSGFTDRIWHLTLPAIALALASLAYVAQVSRAAVATELRRDHVTTAVARGFPRGQVVRRHVLRNAAIPIATVSGVTIAYLITGTAIVEQAFQLNGLGSLLIQSVTTSDLPTVQGVCLVVVLAFLLVNVLVDALYGLLDPRVGKR